MLAVRSLLLNASYEPMRIICWRKAMILWYLGKVEVLEYHQAKRAKTPTKEYKLPSVMRLKTYIRDIKKNTIKFCRENLYLRDDYQCQYCGEYFHPKDLTMDHVFPASRGGQKSWTNVVSACRPCNQKKGNRTPEEARMPVLKKPVRPNWLPSNRISMKPDSMPGAWRNYLY